MADPVTEAYNEFYDEEIVRLYTNLNRLEELNNERIREERIQLTQESWEYLVSDSTLQGNED
jgi:hypothetical protein